MNGEEITGSFYEKELQKTNQKEFRIEKVLKGKGDIRFNSWIDKKGFVSKWVDTFLNHLILILVTV